MSYAIVGVHGLANKPEMKTLHEWWKASILEGLARNCRNKEQKVNFEIVYWADVRYPKPILDSENTEPFIPAEGEGPLKTYKDWWLDDVVASGLGLLAKPLDWAKQHLGVSSVADAVLEAKLKDLDSYYQDANMMKEMRDRLTRTLEANKNRRIMLIAHSMGSIIAYDVLRAMGRQRRDLMIDHFITIGSPLGLPHVKYKIWKENNLVRTPSIVKRWTNFAERRDPVALDVHLSDDYAANVDGVQVKDDLIVNGYKGRSGSSNYHKSYGYLRAPEISQAIRAFL